VGKFAIAVSGGRGAVSGLRQRSSCISARIYKTTSFAAWLVYHSRMAIGQNRWHIAAACCYGVLHH
jgi:hypothetical protein